MEHIMRLVSQQEINVVTGGNALDTTTGSFNRRPEPEPGLGHVYSFGFFGAFARLGFSVAMRLF
jgi:hypothetical protein